jgi:hypothetical protein
MQYFWAVDMQLIVFVGILVIFFYYFKYREVEAEVSI